MATNLGGGTKTKKTAVNGMNGDATGGGVDVGGPKKAVKAPDPMGKGVTPVAGPTKATAAPGTGSGGNAPGTPGGGAQGATNIANANQAALAKTPPPAMATATSGGPSNIMPGGANANAAAATNVAPTAAIPGYNQGTTDPLTGLMAQFGYTPQGLGNLYGNPNQLAGDVLGTLGINNAGLAAQFGDYMNPALFANLLLNGGQGASLNDNDALNFVANYMQQMGTPGGRTPQLDVLFNKILGAAGQGQGTPLYDYFNYDPSSGQALSPTDQVKVANQAFGQAMTSMNPLAQRAYAAMLAEQGQQYQQGLNKGQDMGPDYLSYLNTTGLPGYIRR